MTFENKALKKTL